MSWQDVGKSSGGLFTPWSPRPGRSLQQMLLCVPFISYFQRDKVLSQWCPPGLCLATSQRLEFIENCSLSPTWVQPQIPCPQGYQLTLRAPWFKLLVGNSKKVGTLSTVELVLVNSYGKLNNFCLSLNVKWNEKCLPYVNSLFEDEMTYVWESSWRKVQLKGRT